jgi:hypothetical protein
MASNLVPPPQQPQSLVVQVDAADLYSAFHEILEDFMDEQRRMEAMEEEYKINSMFTTSGVSGGEGAADAILMQANT